MKGESPTLPQIFQRQSLKRCISYAPLLNISNWFDFFCISQNTRNQHRIYKCVSLAQSLYDNYIISINHVSAVFMQPLLSILIVFYVIYSLWGIQDNTAALDPYQTVWIHYRQCAITLTLYDYRPMEDRTILYHRGKKYMEIPVFVFIL